MMEKLPRLDILIVDIDDTLLYHQTVATANRLFLIFLSRFFRKEYTNKNMIKTSGALKQSLALFFLNFHNLVLCKVERKYFSKMLLLFLVGLRLHASNIYRRFVNRFRSKENILNSERMLERWARVIIRLGIDEKDYGAGIPLLDSRPALMYLNMLRKDNKKMKVVGITQSFLMGDDVKKALRLDILFSNRFVSKYGKIVSYDPIVKNGGYKLAIAKRLVKKNMKVGIMIDNYDDVLLNDLENVSLVIYRKKLKRFVTAKDSIAF